MNKETEKNQTALHELIDFIDFIENRDGNVKGITQIKNYAQALRKYEKLCLTEAFKSGVSCERYDKGLKVNERIDQLTFSEGYYFDNYEQIEQ